MGRILIRKRYEKGSIMHRNKRPQKVLARTERASLCLRIIRNIASSLQPVASPSSLSWISLEWSQNRSKRRPILFRWNLLFYAKALYTESLFIGPGRAKGVFRIPPLVGPGLFGDHVLLDALFAPAGRLTCCSRLRTGKDSWAEEGCVTKEVVPQWRAPRLGWRKKTVESG